MMVDERNGNVYSQRLANQIQMKLNNCPFTPHNFKLSYDLESYENENSNKLSDKVQLRRNMENFNSKMFFEAMKLKNMPRHGSNKKIDCDSSNSTNFHSTGKFYHLSFEPLRIEDYKEIDDNKVEDGGDSVSSISNKQKSIPASDCLNNNNNNKGGGSANLFRNANNSLPSNNSSVPHAVKKQGSIECEEKPLLLPNVTASKLKKRGSSRKLPSLPCQVTKNNLSSTMPDLIATTKIPSLLEEIMTVYNRDRKNNCKDYVFPQGFHLDGLVSNIDENIGPTIEDLGFPELIDPVKKYSDLYLNESYVRAIVCFQYLGQECAKNREEEIMSEEIVEQTSSQGVGGVEYIEANELDSLQIKEPDLPSNYSNADYHQNVQRSRKSSINIDTNGEELKRDSSVASRNSDNQSVVSQECGSDAGSRFPSGFHDIELYLEESDATHRGCHKFLPRHSEEIAVEIGDSLFVEKEHDDLWCEGINLRTKKRGIFPTAYATDLSLLGNAKQKYFVNFLGSIEVGHHTGHEVLCKAIKKLASRHNKLNRASTILSCLEIEENGIKITERKKKTPTSRILSTFGKLSLLKSMQQIEHVFLLKNITFCGVLPNNDNYSGFITKHPICMKFACHVFQASVSGRTIVETIGNSLSKFHQEFLSVAYPVEDIYFE